MSKTLRQRANDAMRHHSGGNLWLAGYAAARREARKGKAAWAVCSVFGKLLQITISENAAGHFKRSGYTVRRVTVAG